MHTSYPWKLHRTVLARDSPSQVVCQRVYSHKAQVLDIVASPTSTQQFLSAHAGDDGSAGCTLWSMQDLHSTVVMTLTSPLEALATFPDALAGRLQCFECIFRRNVTTFSADFKRSHQDVIYCAGLSGVSAHAISSGGTRETAKGGARTVCLSLHHNHPLLSKLQ